MDSQVHNLHMGAFHHIRIVASGLLLLAGTVAVCPQAAHGSLTHSDTHEAESRVPAQETDGHDHDACEYEVVHTHNIRLSCSPDELASQLLAAYGHAERLRFTAHAHRVTVCKSRARGPGAPGILLRTVHLLL